jgi:hypothetical protein
MAASTPPSGRRWMTATRHTIAPGQVHEHLDAVRPDGRDHASLLGVEDHGHAEHDDAPPLRDAGGHGQDEGRRRAAGCRRRACDTGEDGGGDGAYGAPEPALQQLVGRVDLAPEVGGDEERRDEQPSDDVADDELQERPVAAVGGSGRADERERARLGGDDAGGDGPPGHAARGQEVVAHGAAAPPQPGAEGGDADDVSDEDDQRRQGKLQGRAARRGGWATISFER